MKRFIFALLSALMLFAAQAAAQPSPQQVLESVDDVRAPGKNFVFNITTKQIGKDNATEFYLETLVRESTKSLVLYREPEKWDGRVILLDGQDAFVYTPGTSRALRISPAQQMASGVTHADVARVVFSIDYSANAVESVLSSEGQPLYKLALTAKSNKNTYRNITLYCSQKYEPVKAEFYGVSGKLLRTAYYENYQMVLGKMRPMGIRLISAVSNNENVLLTYSNMQEKTTPAHYYQPSYLNQIR